MLPWALFGIFYGSLGLFPSYLVNDIDTRGLYDAELSLFGVIDGAERVIPGVFFTNHSTAFLDFLAGVFYLCWVPVPLAFAVYLFFAGKRDWMIRFGWCFLFVNLIGFVGYYVHPAAPPWYVLQYGFEPIFNTGGSTAGLARFDELVGFPVFGSIYVNNTNVFAAVPSLHAAYMMVTTYYCARSGSGRWMTALFAVICVGIWWTAVYSTHHYVIDVILGILTAILGIFLFERWLMKTRFFAKFMDNYFNYIR